MAKFVQHLPPNLDVYSSLDMYKPAYDKAGYKMPLQSVVEKFLNTEQIYNYYLYIKDTDDSKMILSKDEYESVTKAVELILASPRTHFYFRRKEIYHEIIQQLPLYFDIQIGDDTFSCKGLVDGILIDHSTKKIYPYDLKTTSKSVYEFKNSFLGYGYFRQAAMYTLGLQKADTPIKKYLEEGYTMEPFRFIVAETKPYSTHPALIFVTSDQDIKAGLYGGYVGKIHYKGIYDLLKAYRYHVDTGNWDLPHDVALTQGELPLHVFDSTHDD